MQVHKGQVRSALLGWGLPVVLTALFAEANPVLDRWLGDLIPTTLPTPNPVRWVFWLFIALLSWPCLILWRLKERLGATRHTVKADRSIDIINPQSVMRSLVMFNI